MCKKNSKIYNRGVSDFFIFTLWKKFCFILFYFYSRHFLFMFPLWPQSTDLQKNPNNLKWNLFKDLSQTLETQVKIVCLKTPSYCRFKWKQQKLKSVTSFWTQIWLKRQKWKNGMIYFTSREQFALCSDLWHVQCRSVQTKRKEKVGLGLLRLMVQGAGFFNIWKGILEWPLLLY